MCGESAPGPANHFPARASSASGSDQHIPAIPDPPRLWGRADRNRLLVWVAIGFVLPGPFIFAVHHILKQNSPQLTVQTELPSRAVNVFFISLATWVVSRMEKRTFAEYGIPLRQVFAGRFWEGSLWGFTMLSVILLILRASGNFRIDSVALAGSSAFLYALGWAAALIGVAWNEEFSFRGYWLFSFSRRLRFWPAAIFISVVFAVAHLGNPGENPFGIAHVFATGVLFCLMVRRTGNLWFALGYHAAWDWAETFFYGTPDSGLLGVGRFLNTSVQGPAWLTGGSAGPEGSILALAILGLCALLIHVRFPKAVYPDRPV